MLNWLRLASRRARPHAAINSTADVDNNADEIDITLHGFQTGDGPVRLTITSGLLPTPLLIDTDYWIIVGPIGGVNGVQLATTQANAAAGTAIALTVAVGVFVLAMRQAEAYLVEEPDFAPEVRARLEEDLQGARQAQAFLSPKSEGEFGRLRYATRTYPGRFVAGDLFDIFRLDDHRVGICPRPDCAARRQPGGPRSPG